MNERIKECWLKAAESTAAYPSGQNNSWETQVNFMDKFAELIVQDCANFVRENYDHEAAESIAWCMEIKYGLHGDYA